MSSEPSQGGRNSSRTLELSLSDMLAAIQRHRSLIFALILLSTALCATYLFLAPRYHYYSSLWSIGVIPGNDLKLELIEPPETLVSRLNEIVIPEVLSKRTSTEPAQTPSYQISATALARGRNLRLDSKAEASRSAAVRELQNEVSDYVRREHKEITDTFRAQLQSERNQTLRLLDSLHRQRKVAMEGVRHVDRATSSYLRNNETQLSDEALSGLVASLTLHRSSLQLELSRVQSEIETNAYRLDRNEQRLSKVRETQVVSPSTDVGSAQSKWWKRLLLAGLLGSGMGVALSFALEFRGMLKLLADSPLAAQRT